MEKEKKKKRGMIESETARGSGAVSKRSLYEWRIATRPARKAEGVGLKFCSKAKSGGELQD